MNPKKINGKWIVKVDGYDVNASDLWSIFKNYCLQNFPMALKEAVAKSKEFPKKEMGFYDFEAGK